MSSQRKHLVERKRSSSFLYPCTLFSFFIILCTCLLTPSAHAASGKVGINFWTTDYGGSVSNSWLATNVSVGVVAQTNWNNT